MNMFKFDKMGTPFPSLEEKTMSNYPDDIRQYDDDPRSPFYDDKGYEGFFESRVNELMESPDEIEGVDLETIGEAVMDVFKQKDYCQEKTLHNLVNSYLEKLAEKQADDEFSNPDCDGPDDEPEPEDW